MGLAEKPGPIKHIKKRRTHSSTIKFCTVFLKWVCKSNASHAKMEFATHSDLQGCFDMPGFKL